MLDDNINLTTTCPTHIEVNESYLSSDEILHTFITNANSPDFLMQTNEENTKNEPSEEITDISNNIDEQSIAVMPISQGTH